MSEAKFTDGPWLVNPVKAWVEVPDRDAPICAMLWPTDLRSEDETFVNARLIAAAPDFATACGADLHPGENATCGPLAWLKCAIDTLNEDKVREAANAAEDADPDAYWEMVVEVEQLHAKLSAALSKATGDPA